MPIANGFLSSAQFANEFFFELEVAFCEPCSMVQLSRLIEPDRMFHENYAFYSSTSARMAAHFEQYADWVGRTFLPAADPFVVELGSNDGIMLRHFARRGTRHLGIEPSSNVADVAQKNGVRTVCRFFDPALAAEIREKDGPAHALLGANVMCHIPDLDGVAEGADRLLAPDGVLIFEDPYLGEIIKRTSYDQIYDEHAFYFSLASVSKVFERHGFELVDALPQPTHGGSMRYVLARRGARPKSPNLETLRKQESDLGLTKPETFARFALAVQQSRDHLRDLLDKLKRQGRRVVGYGATSKSTTVTNYCGITTEHLEFISDTTPIKQGKFSPGMHIPIRPYEDFRKQFPEFALLFAWNHAAEIMAKESDFCSKGRWISYVPEVAILG